MIERGAKDDDEQDLPPDLVRRLPRAHVKPRVTGDAIGVVVAEGEIVDGQAPAGTIGGLSTANLIRKARDDKDVKAIVLRVDSPGGSVFGSELVRRELELTRAAGKPVVVSMGDVAASGGYWISTASDEIIADAGDDHRLDRRVRAAADAPTRRSTSSASTPPASARRGCATPTTRACRSTRASAQLVQTSIDHIYREFTTKVAAARKTTPEKIDAVAQGRVWTGAQAQGARPGRHASAASAMRCARRRRAPSSATSRASSTSSASRAGSRSSSTC